MALENELAVFNQALPGLLREPANHGRYALVSGTALDSTWPTIEEAIEAGYHRFGIGPFLVKEIVAVETPRQFSRNLTRCR